MSFSVIILTLNEERNLPDCLDSVKQCDDIVVLDSQSSDSTIDIAKDFGARVVTRRFDNWSAHQNWAMENISFKYPWVFYLDADERMTPELCEEIKAIADNPHEQRVALYCGRKNMFMGQWIRHCYPPGMIMRFFRPHYIRFERLVNPTPIINGPHGYLRNYFVHYNFSKGLTEWFDKHNKYSQFEALEGAQLLKFKTDHNCSLISTDKAVRRKALKNLSFRLPFRPVVKFLYLYGIRLGFMDGYPGLVYCCLQSIYEYMIALKMKEIEQCEKGVPF